MPARWRVKFDEPSWQADLASATPAARREAETWRRRIELVGYASESDLLRCDPEDDRWHLPRCVKTRIPDHTAAELRLSPWGAVLQGNADEAGPYLEFVAFGLRHPEAVGSHRPSVYEVAHSRVLPSG